MELMNGLWVNKTKKEGGFKIPRTTKAVVLKVLNTNKSLHASLAPTKSIPGDSSTVGNK